MSTEIKPTVDWNFQYDANKSRQYEFAPPVLEAINLARQCLGCEKSAIAIFLPLAKLISPAIEENTVWGIVKEILEIGCDVFIYHLNGALMQCTVPEEGQNLRFELFFNTKHAHAPSGEVGADRQKYLHFVKILHEFAHWMTPKLLSAVRSLSQTSTISTATGATTSTSAPPSLNDIPSKIGTIWIGGKHTGDCGNGLEDIVFGGRVHCDTTTEKTRGEEFPYEKPLRLIQRKFDGICPGPGNMKRSQISDEYISGVLRQLEAWTASGGIQGSMRTDDFPCLMLPKDALDEVSSSFAETKEEAGRRVALKKRKHHTDQCINNIHSDDNNISDSDDSDYYDDALFEEMVHMGLAYGPEQLKILKRGFKI